jgi:DMSO reductase anchor subunit
LPKRAADALQKVCSSDQSNEAFIASILEHHAKMERVSL